MTNWLYAFLVSFGVATFATWIMIRIRIADNPDAVRKLHARVTPTSGGVGIIAGTLAGLAFLWLFNALTFSPVLIACVVASCMGGTLGLLDDIYVLGPKRKLAVMLAITTAFAVFGARIETIELTREFQLYLGAFIGGIGTIFWLLVMVNTVNFMDGANGLSMGSSAIGLFAVSGLLGVQGEGQIAMLGWVTASACLGFLVWNAFTGSIFAGDSGALFVGLMSGTLGAWAVTVGVNPFCIALCFLPLLVDVILTVLLRLARRQNVLQPHSEHAYQRLIKAGLSHFGAARFYWLRCASCGIIAIIAQHKGGFWPITMFVALLAVLCLNQLAIRRQSTKAIAVNEQTQS
jgi:UDP-GlcNAc:undecaprenyl-phosphate/decaprenyl-phosphate GlcNAc-1-phosphate transferase